MIMYCPSREPHTPSDIAGSVSSYTSVPGPMPLPDTLYRHSALARPVSLVCRQTAIMYATTHARAVPRILNRTDCWPVRWVAVVLT